LSFSLKTYWLTTLPWLIAASHSLSSACTSLLLVLSMKNPVHTRYVSCAPTTSNPSSSGRRLGSGSRRHTASTSE